MTVDLQIPANHIPERLYAAHVLLFEHLGLQYNISTSPHADSWMMRYREKQCEIPDAFFGKYPGPRSYLQQAAIPQKAITCKHPELSDVVLLYGNDTLEERDHTIDCGVDVFAGAFFMLSRWEEIVVPTRDKHGRFPSGASLAGRSELLGRPIVDEYSALLKRIFLRMGVPPGAFAQHHYQKHLTVDVDHAYLWSSPLRALRHIAGRILRERSLGAGFDAWRSYRHYQSTGEDPYDRFAYLSDLSERSNARLTYHFMTGGEHAEDPGHTLADKRVGALFTKAQELGAGTGIHPSYETGISPEMFAREVAAYKAFAGIAPRTGRQHYLRVEVPGTWLLYEHNGVHWTSSMAYADRLGFRCGTCRPFPLFDVISRRMLHVRERPLLIMDVTLRMYENLEPGEAIDRCLAIRNQVKLHNGEFVVLWHNSSFYSATWKGYQRVLEAIMN